MSVNVFKSLLPALSCSALLLLASAAPVSAQEPPPTSPPAGDRDDLVLVIDKDQRPRLRLAFPAFERPTGLSPEELDAAIVLEQTLRDDLGMSGVFDVQGPDVLSILELTGERDRDFELYRSLTNEVVLLARLRAEPGQRLALEGRLYDLESRSQILGKLYRGELAHVRRIAHTFSDEIVLYFSGRRGIALSTIAFVSSRDEEGNKELYLMDYDGFNQRRISGHRSLSLSPAWSPDGSQLAYVSYFAGPPGLYRVDLASGRKEPILSDGEHNMSPSFSPDGETISFSRSVRGNSEVYAIPSPGGALHQLTSSRGIDTNPAWGPNGRDIAFTSSRSGTPQIYVMDAEGTNPRRLTFEGNYNDGASWHPDGTKIAYSTREAGGSRFDIAVVDVVTGESQIVTAPPGSHEAPSFSPDGRLIAFESSRTGRRQIWVMEANGQALRQLTVEGENFAPAWSGQPR